MLSKETKEIINSYFETIDIIKISCVEAQKDIFSIITGYSLCLLKYENKFLPELENSDYLDSVVAYEYSKRRIDYWVRNEGM